MSKEVIKEVAKKYKELTGRGFELFEEYKTEDADVHYVDYGFGSRNCERGCR